MPNDRSSNEVTRTCREFSSKAFPGWGLAGMVLWLVMFGASFTAYTVEVGTAFLPVAVVFAWVLLGAVAGADRWVHRNNEI